MELSDVICHPLCKIFETSIKTTSIPDDWKDAKISAIYKNGNKTLASNYRPIRGHHTDVIYLDFKKAFDTVPHKRLISKLNSLNISKEIVNWIEAFISNRSQKVAVNGKESNWHDVTSGIPQGTVLGPLLFVLFINALPDLTQSDTFLFADDIKIFRS